MIWKGFQPISLLIVLRTQTRGGHLRVAAFLFFRLHGGRVRRICGSRERSVCGMRRPCFSQAARGNVVSGGVAFRRMRRQYRQNKVRRRDVIRSG